MASKKKERSFQKTSEKPREHRKWEFGDKSPF